MARSRAKTGEISYLNSHRRERTWDKVSEMTGGTDISRLLELYYWSLEPGVIEMTRMYLEMPQRARRALSQYLAAAQPRSIVASTDAAGRLILSQSNEMSNGRPDRKRSSAG